MEVPFASYHRSPGAPRSNRPIISPDISCIPRVKLVQLLNWISSLHASPCLASLFVLFDLNIRRDRSRQGPDVFRHLRWSACSCLHHIDPSFLFPDNQLVDIGCLFCVRSAFQRTQEGELREGPGASLASLGGNWRDVLAVTMEMGL